MNGPSSIASPIADRLPLLDGAQVAARRTATTTGARHGASRTAVPQQQDVARLKSLLTDPEMRISTHHDRASGQVVLQVQRESTGELVEQIPSSKLLRLYAMMRESLVDEQV